MPAFPQRFRSVPVAALAGLALVLAAACAGPGPDPTGAPPPRVRVAMFPNVTHAAGLVAVARGGFQAALGEKTALDVKVFNAGPSLIESLYAGEIDLAYIGPNPAVNGYVRSRGEALRVLAGAASGGAQFVLRSGLTVQGAADLAGLRLATPQLANTQDVALRRYLVQHGLRIEARGGPVRIIPTHNPDILTLLLRGDLDGAWVPEPWASRLILEAGATVFLDEREIWPEGQFITTLLIVNRVFLDRHPALVDALVAAHLDAVCWIQAEPAAAQQLVNNEIGRITGKPLPAAVLERAFANLDITWDPLPDTLRASAEHAWELGFLGQDRPDLDGLFVMGPLNRALGGRGLPEVDWAAAERTEPHPKKE